MEKINKLAAICKKSQSELLGWLRNEMFKYYGNKKIKATRDYLYIKGSLPVCVVAHLDTVHAVEPEEIYYDVVLKNLYSPTGIGGDDRCGVYIILELLERGLRPSIIFCTDEEIGALGANAFTKVYSQISNVNWFLEFDRRGRNDVVCYDDGNEELTKVFEKFGFKSAWGSFSDISELAPFYGISAVNISSGYYAAHTKDEYINMDDLEWIIDSAEKVLRSEYVNNKYEYEDTLPKYTTYTPSKSSALLDYYDWKGSAYDYYSDMCDMCGKWHRASDLVNSEYGWICMECVKELGLVKCPTCGMYVVRDKDNKCDVCKTDLSEAKCGRAS